MDPINRKINAHLNYGAAAEAAVADAVVVSNRPARWSIRDKNSPNNSRNPIYGLCWWFHLVVVSGCLGGDGYPVLLQAPSIPTTCASGGCGGKQCCFTDAYICPACI